MKRYRIYEELIDQISTASFVYIQKEKRLIVNQKLVSLFGYKDKNEFESLVKNKLELIEESYRESAKHDLTTINKNPGLWTNRYCFKRKDGSIFHGNTFFRKFLEPKSEFYASIYGTIKERSVVPKQASNSDQGDFFLNNTNETQVIFDFDGRIQRANHKYFSLDFFSDTSIKNLNIYDIVRKDYHKKLTRRITQLKKGIPTTPTEYVLCNAAGKQLHVEMYSKRITLDDRKAIITSIRDITAIKETEKKLMEAVIQTEENERNRIAEDLHDELGPFLSGLKLYIDELAAQNNHNQITIEMIEYLKGVTDEATIKVREIIRNLRSQNLINHGLAKALEMNFNRFCPPGITIDMDISTLNIKRNTTLELLIYRIVTELVNNTIKHANATKITILLRNNSEKLILNYSDNGKGYNLKESIVTTHGIGLQSIVNRVKSLKGKYSFRSDPEKDTLLCIQIPLI
jgi:PAS domain S-box-containing protein